MGRRDSPQRQPSVSLEPQEQSNSFNIDFQASGAIYASPLPPPAQLKQYEELLPGVTNRILTLAESEVLHRQDIERRNVTIAERNQRTQRLAMILANGRAYFGTGCGLMIGSYALYTAAGLAKQGLTGTAVAAAISAILPIIAVFLRNNPSPPKSDQAKKTTSKKRQ